MTASSRVLIAGAGDVGIRLGLRLRDRGAAVWCLRRDPSQLPSALAGIAADLSRPADLERLPNPLTHVAFTAAPERSTDENYLRTYVEGLQALLARPELRSPTFQRLVFISSTAVYAQTDGSWVDEQSTTEPVHFSGQRTLQAEALLSGSGIPHSILRSAGIYGPGRTQLLERVASGRAEFDAETPHYTNRIHADDVARALEFLLFHPNPDPILVGVDHEPAPEREVFDWLARELRAPPPRPRPAGATDERRPGRGASNKRVSSARLRELGFTFTYPSYREGYATLLAARALRS